MMALMIGECGLYIHNTPSWYCYIIPSLIAIIIFIIIFSLMKLSFKK